MRRILNLSQYYRVRRIGIVLIVVALVTAIMSCIPAEYNLTVAASPSVGGTAVDLTNFSPYTSGTIVTIQATANAGYLFEGWTAPTGTFADASAATTTFKMPPGHVAVLANFVPAYDLTMEATPTAGGTAVDLTDASPYGSGTEVSIQAAANPGYTFTGWTTSKGGTFGSAGATTTTFTMPPNHVTVTANFEVTEPGPLDHFMCYVVDWGPYIGEVVYLEDQFTALEASVDETVVFANPSQKTHGGVTTPISNPHHHLTIYVLDYLHYEEDWQEYVVEVHNQFGTQELLVIGPIALAVPTQEGGHAPPIGLDHFLLYYVMDHSGHEAVSVGLADQFLDVPQMMVYEPVLFGNPVRKTHGDTVTEIMNPDEHLVFYMLDDTDVETEVQTTNQFGEATLDVSYLGLLAVPSEKMGWQGPTEPLDHFRAYWAEDVTGLPVGESVLLEDQFDVVEALVNNAVLFCNPVEKWHDGLPTEIIDPDHHLTIYSIDVPELKEWTVMVDNQFGTQQFTVFGPVGLAVPTEKAGHAPPVGLDHYLIYEIIAGPPVNVMVDLFDQFLDQPGVMVYEPVLFANPVRKTHDGMIIEIENPDAHLVFYSTDPGPFMADISIFNHFGLQILTVDDAALLGVPSEKIGFTIGPGLANVAVLGDYEFQLTALLWENGISAQPRDWDVISDIGYYDVVILNEPTDPGYTMFLDFLDAADANGVGIVFTSSWNVYYSWGISLLEWHIGDPAGQSQDYWADNVYYRVTAAHPIFAGWSVGDEITIITDGDRDHAWFSGYSGSVIGKVGNTNMGIVGDAVAVGSYGASTHVLLASLGPQQYTNVLHWTPDAKTIFVNAVLYAAGV